MPRTTLDIDPNILRDLRRKSEAEGKTMGAVASELIATALGGDGASAAPPAFEWQSGELGAPRVDLEDKEALRRVLGDGER